MFLTPLDIPPVPRVVAIGNFDGVHDGHKALLAVARKAASLRRLPLWVLTFDPHPRTILAPDKPLNLLMTTAEKIEALRDAGVDEVAVVGFTPTLAAWTPERFIHDVLVAGLRARVVVVGENFRFGHAAAGDVALLHAQGDFATAAVPLLRDAHGVVSSSRLRHSRTL